MSVYLNGLTGHGDYIDFGKSWLVTLKPEGYSSRFKIGDKEVYVGSGSKQEFVAPDTEIFLITRHPKTLTHYEREDGKRLELKEHNVIQYRYYDEEVDYNIYPDLDTEFEHRKQLEELKEFLPQYDEKEDTLTPVILTCVGKAEDTGSPFIKTALAYGKGSFNGSGFYEVDWTSVTTHTFWKFVDDNNLRDVTTNDRHYVRFAKIKGAYVVGEKVKGAEDNKKSVYSDLDAAKRAIEYHINDFTKTLNIKIFGSDKIADKVTVAKIYNLLNDIASRVESLDVKSKSATSKRTLVNHIYNSIKDFKNDL